MIPSINYPDTLPGVLFNNKTAQMVNPKIATELESGTMQQRRAFTAVPVVHEVSWIMSRMQAAIFVDWFENDLIYGTQWFSMKMLVPQGNCKWAFRFIGVYEGPNKVAPDRWEINAKLEQWVRA